MRVVNYITTNEKCFMWAGVRLIEEKEICRKSWDPAGIVMNIAREGQLELAKSSDSAAMYPGLCSSVVGPVCSVARASS